MAEALPKYWKTLQLKSDFFSQSSFRSIIALNNYMLIVRKKNCVETYDDHYVSQNDMSPLCVSTHSSGECEDVVKWKKMWEEDRKGNGQ